MLKKWQEHSFASNNAREVITNNQSAKLEGSTYYNFENCILKKTATNYIGERLDFLNVYIQQILHV